MVGDRRPAKEGKGQGGKGEPSDAGAGHLNPTGQHPVGTAMRERGQNLSAGKEAEPPPWDGRETATERVETSDGSDHVAQREIGEQDHAELERP